MKHTLLRVVCLLGLGGSLAVSPISARAPLGKGAEDEGGPRTAKPRDGTRKVLAAVLEAATANARLPRRGTPGARRPFRRLGDELTEHYIRTAAQAARQLPVEQAVPSFLLALGVGLDDSTLVRNNPITGPFCRNVESSDERKKRLTVLGSPTVRGRRDLAQHFAVSCTLTQLFGASLAEAAGLLKEEKDMLPGGSGFSFADLAADLAGVTFAVRLKEGRLSLQTLEKQFQVKDFIPDPTGLREGLTAAQFTRDYGSLADKRFKDELEKVRRRVNEMPGLRRTRKEGLAPSPLHPGAVSRFCPGSRSSPCGWFVQMFRFHRCPPIRYPV
jgi:hypothetical protein